MKNRNGILIKSLKVFPLTLVVVLAFVFSTIGWHHVESEESTRITIGAIILVIMYALMIFELIHRTLATLIGAAAAIAAYDCLVGYVGMEEILRWEDLETLALLFGMMTIVGVLGTSGLFNYLAIWSYKKASGRFWLLIVIMSFITAVLSALIDNVSTMILMAPTLIKLSELEHIDPRYILMIMVIFCNIGGCATPVGDPPNLIIIGDSLVASLNISFGLFVAYCGPGVLLAMVVILLYLRLRYKTKESFRLEKSSTGRQSPLGVGSLVDSNETIVCCINSNKILATPMSAQVRDQYCIELKLLRSFRDDLLELAKNSPLNEDPSVPIKVELDRQIAMIEKILSQSNGGDRNEKPTYRLINELQLATPINSTGRRGSRLDANQIDELMQVYSIKSWPILISSLTVLVLAILLFFAQSIPGANLTLGWISLFAALTLLVVTSSFKRPQLDEQKGNGDLGNEVTRQAEEDNFEYVMKTIEWSTLIFFFALFIVMEVMSKLGLISYLGRQVTHLIELIPDGQLRTIGSITIILWSSGVASACIDNVPFTSMMIKILGTMIEQQRSQTTSSASDLTTPKLLIFALAFGACFGGNGTIIGASANLVTAGIADKSGYPMSFNGFFKFSAPITILSLLVVNIYLVVVSILATSFS